MSDAGLVIRSALVVDGTGAPPVRADVAIAGGRIGAVGPDLPSGDADVVDADGLVLTPGFIDIHTHYDAQLMFEPTASPSSWHGVTTVVTGNCGFTIAPCRPDDLDWHLSALARVEGMSVAALAAGVDFAGGSMGDFLAHLDGRLGVNVAALVGHCAIRRLVMGDAASERPATAAEIAAMQQVLDAALSEGAAGFSSSQLEVHADHEGRPVPSNVATAEEIVALASVVAAHPGAVIEFVPETSLPGFSDADRQLLLDIAAASHAPVNINIVDRFPGYSENWRSNLAVAEQSWEQALALLPSFRCNPQDMFFSLAETFIFDDVPALRDALRSPQDERDRLLSDPHHRSRMAAELASVSRSVSFGWDDVTVAAVRRGEHRHLEGAEVVDAAAAAGVTPLDWVLDLALAEDLGTVFRIRRGLGEGHRALLEQLVQHPRMLAGTSDAGAHLLTFCGADFTTRLLADFVPDPLSLEQAVAILTSRPAAMLGLTDRGIIRAGAAADLVLFDPERLAVGRTRFVDDFPTGASRLVHDAEGYVAVYVNGRPLLLDGRPTGDLPGSVVGTRR
ncbi:MAG: amidohydrolase family protein [Acidimicrobiales bacterium]|nr:amidohydrolase family protein [Acidimicrobiales bacterium]